MKNKNNKENELGYYKKKTNDLFTFLIILNKTYTLKRYLTFIIIIIKMNYILFI